MNPNIRIISVVTRDGLILNEPAADRTLSQRKAQAEIREYVAASSESDQRPMATRRFFPRIAPDIMPLVELIAVTAAVIMLIIKGVLS